MKEINKYRDCLCMLSNEYKEAEVEAEKKDAVCVGLINQKPGKMESFNKTALFVRVSGDKTGMVYLQDLEKDPGEVLREAYENSNYVTTARREAFQKQAEDNFCDDSTLEHTETVILYNKAKELSHEVGKLSDQFSYIEVKLTETIQEYGIVNSYGVDKSCKKKYYEASINLTCCEPVHRSMVKEITKDCLDDIRTELFLEEIREWLDLPVMTGRLTKNDVPAVLHGTVVCNILLTAWQMFAGPEYLSRGSAFSGLLGKKIGSELVNLVDCQNCEGYGYQKDFDCEGTKTKNTYVIKNGRMNGLLHNLDSAGKMGELATGNAGRDVNLISDQTQIRVIPTNFCLEAGDKTQEQLLSMLDEGIYIYESYDMFHSLNIASGDFAIPCKGIVYSKGRPTGVVEGITMSGNMKELLLSIEAIGSRMDSVSMVMSKSFQVLAPGIYVNNLHVTG